MEHELNLRGGSNFYVGTKEEQREERMLHRGRFIAMYVFGAVLFGLIGAGLAVLLVMKWHELGSGRGVLIAFVVFIAISLACLPALVRRQLAPIWIVERRDDGVWLTVRTMWDPVPGTTQRVHSAVVGEVFPGSLREEKLPRCEVICETDGGRRVVVAFVGTSAQQVGEEADALKTAIARLLSM